MIIAHLVIMLSLSEHDRAVLNCVFNPNLPLDDAYNEELNIELKGNVIKHVFDGLQTFVDVDEEEMNNTEVQKTKPLEVEAVKKAEGGKLREANDLLTKAISLAPNRASLYNNRAQVHRLLGNNLDALNDLTKAIEYSKGIGKSGCQALCQRGLLHRKAGREELAKDDFTAATKLGSQFAKSQLVEMNPYAALCNQMLNKVLQKQLENNNE